MTDLAPAPVQMARTRFLFATGIECSAPTIIGRDGRPTRVDEMERCGHYARWREDFALVNELGLSYLRYGPPYHRTHLGPGRYDWSFADATFAELRRRQITPIVDLCHFGVPDWLGDFQNTDWPALFADYARAFAARFPWVTLYTPINEIYICALFSGLYGWWNERQRSDAAFVRALTNMVRANILAERAILAVQPRAYFIQSETTESFHAGHPSMRERAEFLNQRRFLSLDLCYGYSGVHAGLYEYLLDNGLTREEFHWFMREGRALKPHHIMGNDYYVTNEHLIRADGSVEPAGEVFGYYVITKQYFDRYHLPVMHTETNYGEDGAETWLWKEWANMLRLRDDGVPIIGFTWYSLTDQVDWDTALREENGTVNPLGLYDLDRRLRPVGAAYRELVSQWRDLLPAESLGIDLYLPEVPLVLD